MLGQDVVIKPELTDILGGANVIFRVIDSRRGHAGVYSFSIAPVCATLPSGVDASSALWVFADDVTTYTGASK